MDEKYTSRRRFLSSTASALGGLAALCSGAGCLNEWQRDIFEVGADAHAAGLNEAARDNKKSPAYEDFVEALGDRYIPEKDRELRSEWNKGEAKFKKHVVEIYADSEKAYENLPKDARKRFDEFKLGSLDEAKIKGYEEATPWDLVPEDYNLDQSDMLMLWTIHEQSEDPLKGVDLRVFP